MLTNSQADRVVELSSEIARIIVECPDDNRDWFIQEIERSFVAIRKRAMIAHMHRAIQVNPDGSISVADNGGTAIPPNPQAAQRVVDRLPESCFMPVLCGVEVCGLGN